MGRHCCRDFKNVCSHAVQLQLAAQERKPTTLFEGQKLPACWRKATADKPTDVVEGNYAASDTVTLLSRRSRQKVTDCRCLDTTKHSPGCARKTECACENAGVKDIDRADHDPICNRTLTWVVRVPFETQVNKKAHGDSIRLCLADAARLRYEYAQHDAKIVRVYPLYR